MRTVTARVFEDDIERSRVIGAVRQQSSQDVLHLALNEYVINHRDELEGLFKAVQAAVLSGDSAGLRDAFASQATHELPEMDEETRRAQEMWEGAQAE